MGVNISFDVQGIVKQVSKVMASNVNLRSSFVDIIEYKMTI